MDLATRYRKSLNSLSVIAIDCTIEPVVYICCLLLKYQFVLCVPDYVSASCKRDDHVDSFLTWLHENNVNTDRVSIEKFEVEGYGLKAEREIEVCTLQRLPSFHIWNLKNK